MEVKFPYPKYRIGQREAVEAIVKSVTSMEALALSAPTGFGKTVCILYALKKLRVDRVLYAVRTRNEIQPPLREAVKLGYKPVFLISKKNTCPLLLESKSLPLEDFWENCKILREERECEYFENSSRISGEEVWETLKLGVKGPYRVIRELVSLRLCPYYTLKSVIDYSDLIIVTYPYIFNPVIREYTFENVELEHAVLVVDEAHSLIDLADIIEKKLSTRRVENAIRELEVYTPTLTLYIEKLRELENLWETLPSGRGYTSTDKNVVLEVLGEPQEWYDIAQEIRYKKLLEADSTSRKASVRVHTLSIAIFLDLLKTEEFQLFTTVKRGEKQLTVKLVDPSLIVGPPLTSVGSLILSSGTLPPKSFFVEVLGVDRSFRELDVELEYGPVFPLENRVTIVLTYVTSKFTRRSESLYEKYAEVVRDTFKNTPQITLVVYPSYEFMDNVVKKLRKLDNVIVEGEDTKISEVVEEASKREKILINAVAGGKLCEGVEILKSTGESLIKTVIIAGIPYPQPDDYLEKMLENLSRKIGREKAWDHLVRDTAVVRVKQALGRALRSERDKALFILADYRFMDGRVRSKLKLAYNTIATTHNQYLEMLDRLSSEYF